ncbi:hypothetical protein QYM36_007982 [Artemia franciscana]|uniref:Uncharacterized protein n=1 Tax=Artemia franciscana TaxID=6661 RepID=A0AA88IHC3_ARTSF|nr:hypothetical protein QYM36_007982 [Artemia franciscana]
MMPESWSQKKVATEFQVTEYVVKQARKLKPEQGILAIPDPKKGNILSKNPVKLVTDIYQSDENSRDLPGTKDKNLKLLLDAVKIEESYKDLIKMLVCYVDNSECMLRHCDNRPSDDALIEYLTAKLSEDYDLEEEITISQWVNTDRTEMVQQSISVEGFISLLSKSVENLTPNSYITKSQSKTFKKLKEDLPLNTAIVAMDFSENYSYTIQNEILSYYWNRGGCKTHPVGLYLKKNDKVLISNHYNYVAANYNDKWYFGLVKTAFHEEEDAEILFLRPPGPAASFYWPQRGDLCIIPLEHIISKVDAPQSISTGRMYYYKKECIRKTEKYWMKWKKYN